MPSDLDLLIDHYQWEVQRLESLIKEHKEQHFYEEIILDSKALSKANRELERLLNLKNPNYSKIEQKKGLVSSIKRMEEKFSKEKKLHISFMDDEVLHLKKEISVLESQKKESTFETQVIDEEIYKLLGNQLGEVKLKIKTYDNWFILSITKTNYNELRVEFWMDKPNEHDYLKNIDITKELQFIYNDITERFTKLVTINSLKNILPFKEFLARLIYGLKPGLEFENSFYIEVK